MQRYKHKSREIPETTVTKKEELTEYKLADYVNKNFVWSLLVTLPTLDSLKKIHKILCKTTCKEKELEVYLRNIDKEFFQILHLLYYYVTINKDENVLVRYTLHTSVSLLTETISKLPINSANHAKRPLDAYRKMLKLEKKIKDFIANIVLSDEDNVKIKPAIQAMSEYLDDQFLALDRVFSVIYLKYLEYPDLIHADPKCALMHNILTDFCKDIKQLITMYPDHDFQRLLLAVDDAKTADENVILMTPKKPSSSTATSKMLNHAVAPDVTPTGIDENVKKSAKFIATVLEYHNSSHDKKVIFNAKHKQQKKQPSILEDLEQELMQRLCLDEISMPKSKVCKSLFGGKQDQEA